MVAAREGRVPPGALQRDSARCIVVITADGELAVAIRERIEPAGALIRDVRPAEAGEAVDACRPYPWMVVGEGHMPHGIAALLRSRPVIGIWREPLPPGAPERTMTFSSFAELWRLTSRALRNVVADMRLAPACGVELPDGARVASAPLQALIGAHPRGCVLGTAAARSVSSLLARHGVTAVLSPAGAGTVRLR